VVVVKDSPERLARFHALIAALDRKGAAARRIYIRPVAYLLPSELAKELDEIAGATGDELRMVPDDRTQRLVVITTAAIYRRVDLVARRLDVPGQGRDIRQGQPGSARPSVGIRVLPAPDGSRPGDFPP
jgi:type II secretory pathway component GspD/PulD (secretin)